MNDTTLDTKNMDAIIKSLKGELPRARVGILSNKANRTTVGPNNPTIGAAHEFGTSTGIPQRSFLRVPISEHLQKSMEKSGAFTKEALKEVVRQKSVIPWVKTVAALAEDIVTEAFASGGFGKWPAWKNPNYENNTGQLLKNTQQLSRSISSEVK